MEVITSNWTDYSNTTYYDEPFIDYDETPFIVSIGIIMCIALCGNSATIYVIIKTPYLRTVSHLLIVNLAVIDLGIAMFVCPIRIINSAIKPYKLTLSHQLCDTIGFITLVLFLSAIATLAAISLDRYISICRPLLYPTKATPKRVYSLVLLIWMFDILLSVMPLLGWGDYTYTNASLYACRQYCKTNTSYNALLLVCGFVVPFLAMLLSYIRIIQEARYQLQRIENIQMKLISPAPDNNACDTTDTKQPRTNNPPGFLKKLLNYVESQGQLIGSNSNLARTIKLWKTTLIFLGVFVLCWAPYTAVSVSYMVAGPNSVPAHTVAVTSALVLANCAANPAVSVCFTRDIRYAVHAMMSRFSRRHEESLQRLNSRRSSYSMAPIEKIVTIAPRVMGGDDADIGDSSNDVAMDNTNRRQSLMTLCSHYVDSDEESELVTTLNIQYNKYGSLSDSDNNQKTTFGATLEIPKSSYQN